MTALAGLIARAVDGLELGDGTQARWRGIPLTPVDPWLATRLDPDARRAHMIDELTRRLYLDLYRPSVGRPRRPAEDPRYGEWTPFAASLHAANSAGDGWRGDNLVLTTGPPVVVRFRGIEVRCAEADVRAAPVGIARVGVSIELRQPAGSLLVNPGFYTATGGPPPSRRGRLPRARLYWNIDPGAAAQLVGAVTGGLCRAGIGYALKLASRPSGYDRPDAAVLYVEGSDLPVVRALLPEVWRSVRDHLHPATPALTLRLADGLSFAEQPDTGESFGLHRMGLVARALVGAGEHGVSTDRARVRAVLRAVGATGLDIRRPHLGPGSATVVAKLSARERGAGGGRWGRRGVGDDEPIDLLDVAGRMGHRLSTSALWSGDRCTWLRAELDHIRSPHPPLVTLGPALYDGTAGVALALAEIGARVDDGVLRATAEAAIRQALDRAEDLPPLAIGLHAGRAGIAVAALRIGVLHDRDDLREQARGLLGGETVMPTGVEPDLLVGTAGLCLGLLIACRATGDARFLASAVVCGEWLVTSARRGPAGWSWASPLASGGRVGDLCGLSHGAAGVALALAELARATGERGWRDAALRAHDYERSWFDVEGANWPDLRDPNGGMAKAAGGARGAGGERSDSWWRARAGADSGRSTVTGRARPEAGSGGSTVTERARPEAESGRRAVTGRRPGSLATAPGRPGSMVAWCHGSPGIVLERLHTGALLSDPTAIADARAGCVSIGRWLERARGDRAGFSLCHGVAGNAECLVTAGSVLGSAEHVAIARAALEDGARRYELSGEPWPGGQVAGPTPSLMLGDAGIALALLRSADPSVPSVLLPVPGHARAPLCLPGT